MPLIRNRSPSLRRCEGAGGVGLSSRGRSRCFVGTFSYWHGVAVLEQAIRSLLDKARAREPPLKFLLVGDGPLAPQLRQCAPALCARIALITFTGAVPHNSVRDLPRCCGHSGFAARPHAGWAPVFGSPTKLFEYMAMGKAIAASALDQIV